MIRGWLSWLVGWAVMTVVKWMSEDEKDDTRKDGEPGS